MPTKLQSAGTIIVLPKTGTARNVFSKIDDLGYLASANRQEGESIVNFRRRIYTTYVRPGNASLTGLTDGVARELGLGHEVLLTINTDRDVKLDVVDHKINISGSSSIDTVYIVDSDPNGFWEYPNVAEVSDRLNELTGITSSYEVGVSGLPAVLLERQSSYVRVVDEPVPQRTHWKLGAEEDGRPVESDVLEDTISFTDNQIFQTKVTGAPAGEGQWSFDSNTKVIRSNEQPVGPGRVRYTYNLLTSGNQMNLIGNGAKVINLATPDVQEILFTVSGIGETAKDIAQELREEDLAFWGK